VKQPISILLEHIKVVFLRVVVLLKRVIKQDSGLKPFYAHALYNYVSCLIFFLFMNTSRVFLISVPGGFPEIGV
jgi:hypothetical protein